MAAAYKVTTISLCLLAILVINWNVLNSSNNNNSTVVYYPTIQRRVLEIIEPYIYGLSCGMETEFRYQDGIWSWILKWLWKAWQYILGSHEDFYVCELDWVVITIRFSVGAYQYKPEVSNTVIQKNDGENIASLLLKYLVLIAIYNVFLVIAFSNHCAGKENDGVKDRGIQTKSTDTQAGASTGKSKASERKVSYQLIQSAYTRRPATRGIADALPVEQEMEAGESGVISGVTQNKDLYVLQ